MAKFTVAIVGGGLTGLVFAHALETFAPDVAFEIYEGATQLEELGAGIGMQLRSWAVMQAIGLADSLLPIAGAVISTVHRKSDQAVGIDFSKVEILERNFSFHRAELQRTLINLLRPRHELRLGKRLVSYTQPDADGRVRLEFKDGSSAVYDVLVGADGVRSGVRAAMFGKLADAAQAKGELEEEAQLRKCILPLFSGEVVYRCLIEKDQLPPEQASSPLLNSPTLCLYCGKNKHLISYPISQGKIINVGAGVSLPGTEGTIFEGPYMSRVGREEFAKHYKGWEPDVQELLKHVDGGLMWAINVVNTLPTFVDGNVALMGDAAHAMGHHLGSGAGQGFEGGFLLAQFLGHPLVTLDTLPTALQTYDEIRRPFAQRVAALSKRSSELHHLNGPEFADLTEEESMRGNRLSQARLDELGREIETLREWRDGGSDIMTENAESLRKLEEALAQAKVTQT